MKFRTMSKLRIQYLTKVNFQNHTLRNFIYLPWVQK